MRLPTVIDVVSAVSFMMSVRKDHVIPVTTATATAITLIAVATIAAVIQVGSIALSVHIQVATIAFIGHIQVATIPLITQRVANT
jgi:hypothetical protein